MSKTDKSEYMLVSDADCSNHITTLERIEDLAIKHLKDNDNDINLDTVSIYKLIATVKKTVKTEYKTEFK